MFDENPLKTDPWDFLGGPVVKTSPSNAGGEGLIPDWGTKIPCALQTKNQNIKQQQQCNVFNKHVKNGSHKKTNKIFLKRVKPGDVNFIGKEEESVKEIKKQ